MTDGGRRAPEPNVLLRVSATLGGAYVALRFGLPHLAVWIGASETPAPVPQFAMVIYMTCASVGALLYASSDDRRWRLFLGPVVRLFAASYDAGRRRAIALVAIPLLAGAIAWRQVAPRSDVPTPIRLQHPPQPEAYAALENPVRELPEAERATAELEGVVLYQKNCRPCHGAKADGDGPLARALRLRPVDFTDPGTIAILVEHYPFWRIKEGALGLPVIATPWHSAMPAWSDLTDDEIWRIVMAEYRIAGKEPRLPERMAR